MGVLVNSCAIELEKIGVTGRKKYFDVRLQKDGRHAVNKINRAVSMKIATGDSKRCSILAKKDRLKPFSQRKGVDEMKSF